MTSGTLSVPSTQSIVKEPYRLLAALNQRRLLVILTFLAIFAYNFAHATDIDFWWHLETGEMIANSGAIPAADSFSYTAAGRPWVAHEWLWEFAIYHVYGWGGYALAALISAAIVTLTYLILYRLLRRLGANEFVAAGIVIWASALAFPGTGVRPRELTQLLFAFFISRLFLYRTGAIGNLWVLPPLMVLWVNVHGQFILGIALLGLFATDATVRWLLTREESPLHLLAVAFASLIAACVNPGGPAMLRYPIDYYLHGDNPSFALVTEFQSPDFHQPLYMAFAASLLLLTLIPGRPSWRTAVELVLVVVFTLQAMVSVRQISAYVLVIAPILALRLMDRFSFARELSSPVLSRPLLAMNWVILLAVPLMAFVYVSQPAISHRLQLGREPLARALPVAGADFIENANLPDPVFNEQTWGGYLISQWYPERKVFIDGRIDMYGSAIVREYRQVITLRPDWRDVLDKYGVRTILIEKDSPLSTLLLESAEWDSVFRGNVEEVFVRSSGIPSGRVP